MFEITDRNQHASSEQVRNLKIGYIGGGSQEWAHTLINDVAQCEGLSGTVALYDVNYEPAAKNATLGNQLMEREETTGNWTFEAHHDIDTALEGADFVICSIQDPPEETFVHDIDIPKEYGIAQTVGDTVGPGGTVRALRAIPQYREIAATIRECCPDAWVINYTNPMTVCTRTLYEEYPDINAIGLCHEVFKTQELFAEIAETHIYDAENVDRDEINLSVKGVNHFTWVDEAHWRDHNLFQYLDAELEKYKPLPGYESGDMNEESYYVNNRQIAFDLYDRFGILGAAGDRHLAEFVPWYLAIEDSEEVHRWGIRLTPSSSRISKNDGPNKTDQYLSGDETFQFDESGEEAVKIIQALVGEKPLMTNINYPNEGQVKGLPEKAVVETNALITGNNITPLCAGELPQEVHSMVERHVVNQETLIDAGFSGDLDLAFQAFLNQPLVDLQTDDAQDLFTDLVEAERDYLEDYDFSAKVLQD